MAQEMLGIWQRMGPKLMNCCKPEQVGTKEYGKMFLRRPLISLVKGKICRVLVGVFLEGPLGEA